MAGQRYELGRIMWLALAAFVMVELGPLLTIMRGWWYGCGLLPGCLALRPCNVRPTML
jgi:hypothetical protein